MVGGYRRGVVGASAGRGFMGGRLGGAFGVGLAVLYVVAVIRFVHCHRNPVTVIQSLREDYAFSAAARRPLRKHRVIIPAI